MPEVIDGQVTLTRASVYTVTAKVIAPTNQPGNGGDYMAIYVDPQGVDNSVSGFVSI